MQRSFKPRVILLRALTLALGLTVAAPASAVTVTLLPTPGDYGIRVAYSLGVFPFFSFPAQVDPSSLPAAGHLESPPVDPRYVAAGDYDLGHGGFDFSFDLTRTDDSEASAFADVDLIFTVDEAASYDLAGEFSVGDPTGHTATFDVLLSDVTDGVDLFRSLGHNNGSPDPQFHLLGDGFSLPQGTLQGTLLPGHTYRLRMDALLYAWDLIGPVDQGALASGSGFVTLAIPEPAIPALLAAAGLAMLARRGA